MNQRHLFTFKKVREQGFTFIELLVVLATVAILAVLLLPAIAGTKPNSQAFQCMENQRQLTLGWQMYAADNTDLLPPNDYPYTTAYYGPGTAKQAKLRNWVVGTMVVGVDAVDRAYALGGVSELLDPNTLLSPYVKNRTVYRCPADNYIDPYAGNSVHVRSYSMNSAIGTIWSSSSAMGGGDPRALGSPVTGGWLSGAGYIGGVNPTWLTYAKMTSLTKPGPANTFIIMDENPRTINEGAINVSAAATLGNTYLIDYPTGNHNGAAAISFADGHVIVHKWQDSRTYTVTPFVQGNLVQDATRITPDDADCFYLAPITSAHR
jgi:prepilin-type N-terminal cleavage/methylation domain-containing protein/prepilin-type processing-associated H-X9-DG protein